MATPDSAQPADSQVRVLIIATSLNPKSKSLVLAQRAQQNLEARKIDTRLIWLRDVPLPLCDGSPQAGKLPEVIRMREEFRRCTHVIFAVPVYNWDVNAAAKNLIEHVFNWSCWKDGEWDGIAGKSVGFLCVGGGSHSYMSVVSFANSLALECRWWVVPRYVYAVFNDFENGQIKNEKILERINLLLDELLDPRRTAINPY